MREERKGKVRRFKERWREEDKREVRRKKGELLKRRREEKRREVRSKKRGVEGTGEERDEWKKKEKW